MLDTKPCCSLREQELSVSAAQRSPLWAGWPRSPPSGPSLPSTSAHQADPPNSPRPVLFRNPWEGGCGWPAASACPSHRGGLWPVGSCPVMPGRNLDRQRQLGGREGAQCEGTGRGTAGVGCRQDCHGLFSSSWFYFKHVSDIGNALMCFVTILDDSPITSISQQLFTGLNSLFFL